MASFKDWGDFTAAPPSAESSFNFESDFADDLKISSSEHSTSDWTQTDGYVDQAQGSVTASDQPLSKALTEHEPLGPNISTDAMVEPDGVHVPTSNSGDLVVSKDDLIMASEKNR